MFADGSSQTNVSNHASSDYQPNWSPDGGRIAFTSNRDGNNEIYIMDADGGNPVNISNHGDSDSQPNWAPSGNQLAFTSTRDGQEDIYIINANGIGTTKLTNHNDQDRSPAWSPDGNFLAFTTLRDGNWKVHVMDTSGTIVMGPNHFEDDFLPDWQPVVPLSTLSIAKTTNPSGGSGFPFTIDPGPYDFLRKWGMQGAGNGQFDWPHGIAFDDTGDIIIVDRNNHRVQKFDSNGNYLTQWGTQGTGNGQFNFPRDLVLDAAGNIYVSDENHRIQKFDNNGNYLLQWGSLGSGNGQFNRPLALDTDSAGNIYVADTENNRVQKFDNTGGYLLQWALLDWPHGIAIDDADNVYVSETNNHRVQKFDSSGVLLDTFGSFGTGNGQFSRPTGVAVDDLGYVYVSEFDNNRIQKFDQNGDYVSQWGSSGTLDGQFDVAIMLEVDSTGTVYVADMLNHRIQVFGPQLTPSLDDGQEETFVVPSGDYLVREMTPGGWAVGDISCDGGSPQINNNTVSISLGDGDDVTCTFTNFLPPELTIVKSTNPSGGSGFPFIIDPASYSFQDKWGSFGPGNGQFKQPHSVVVDTAGDIYVADRDNHRIQQFDSEGNYLDQWGGLGSGNGQFNSPYDLALDAAGNAYVADAANHRIQKFDASGVYLAQWGGNGNGDGQFNLPFGVALDSKGNVYVADRSNHRIQKFDADGNYLLQWGTQGVADGQFDFPFDVEVDIADIVYVADTNNHRIQKFDASGVHLATWAGTDSSGAVGEFNGPVRVATDLAGHVYVSEFQNNRIQKFDQEGNYLTHWGEIGGANGQLNWPYGVDVNGAGDVYVADSNNSRIQLFKSEGATSLDDGQETSFTIVPGSVLVSEFMPQGWRLESIQCNSGNPQISASTVSLNVNGGETITCTFNNEQLGTVIVNKATSPAGGTGFTFTEDIESSGFGLDDGDSVTFNDVPAGVYSVTEDDPGPAFALSSLLCTDSDGGGTASSADVPSRTATINLDPGETVECTFTNGLPTAALTILKHSNPPGGAGFSFTVDPGSYDFLFKFGGAGTAEGQLDQPHGLAIDSNGDIYITEANNNRVSKYDSSGTFLRMWGWGVDTGTAVLQTCTAGCQIGQAGNGNGQFNVPRGITVAANDTILVNDENNDRVQMFDTSGAFLGILGGPGTSEGQFDAPSQTAVDAAGNRYVVERNNHRLQKFDSNGVFLRMWGKDVDNAGGGGAEICTSNCKKGATGSGNGEFNQPVGVAVDREGNVLVVDYLNSRVQKFDSDGNYLSQWGSFGSADGQFNTPWQITVDAAGNNYVGEIGGNRVQKFDSDGGFLGKWGSGGSADGQFNSVTIAVANGEGDVYVADHSGDRIQVFSQTGTTLEDGQNDTLILDPGSYLVSELVPPGWDVNDISCDGGGPLVDGNTVLLSLAAGDDLICTFINDAQAPELTVDHAIVQVGEGDVATNNGLLSNPGGSLNLNASIGHVQDNGNGTWSWDFQTTDGTAESQTVTITADNGLAHGEVMFDLIVNNIPPSVISVTGPNGPVELGDHVVVTVEFDDPGSSDNHDVTWIWDDGEEDTQNGVLSPANQEHTYAAAGLYDVEVIVADEGVIRDSAFVQIEIVETEGTIIIEKQTIFDGVGDQFEFGGDLGQFFLTDNEQFSLNKPAPAIYLVTELEAGFYELIDISCDSPGSSGDTGTQTATIDLAPGETITCIFTNENPPPEASDDNYDVVANIQLSVSTPGVLGNDSDPLNEPLTAHVNDDVDQGTLNLNPDGSFDYTPDLDYIGPDQFSYYAFDAYDGDEAMVTLDIACPAGTANIFTFVWDDANGDGLQDPGENGVPDLTVDLLDQDDTLIRTRQTTIAGEGRFICLAPGQYRLQYTLPTGFDFTARNVGADDTIDSDARNTGLTPKFDIVAGQDMTDWDAGLTIPATIQSRVWNDLNGDGIQDAAENTANLQGVTVNLLDAANGDALLNTAVTDSQGIATFNNVPTDRNVRLQFVPPAGYGITIRDAVGVDSIDSDARNSGTTASFNAGAMGIVTDWDAGLWSPGQLEMFVWDDLNEDGVQDGGEPGVPAVVVRLLDRDNGDAELAMTVSDANGLITFSEIPADRRLRLLVELPADANKFTRRGATTEDLDSDIKKSGYSANFKADRGAQLFLDIDAGIRY